MLLLKAAESKPSRFNYWKRSKVVKCLKERVTAVMDTRRAIVRIITDGPKNAVTVP